MRRRSRYCISETSPPKPTTVVSAKERRRLTSVNRARDPYDADEESFVSYGTLERSIREHTKVICCNHNAIFEFESYYRGTGNDRRLCMLVRPIIALEI